MNARRLAAALALALPALAAGEPVAYRLTPTHSFVHFEWPHAGLSTLRGRFDKVAGSVQLDRAAGRGRGAIELRLDSVNTGRPTLDAALRSALVAGGEPVASIEIEAVRFDGDRPVAATARLAWRGGAQVVELRAERFNCYRSPLLGREVCGGDFDAVVEPQRLAIAVDPAFGLGSPVRLRVQVEAVRQEPGS